MKLSLFIAKRYLFSKKKQNAINIISVISVVGVAIGTSALVIILSVFNGIDLLLQKSADSFTPDLVISPLTGKFSHFDDSLYQALRNNSSVAYYNQIVEEKALVKYDDKLSPVTIKGVADDYARNTHFEDNIIQGTFQLKTGDTYKSVVGYGLAAELGIGLNFLTPMVFYYPDKNAGVSASALNTAYLYPSAFFSSQQEIEGQYVLTDLEFAQRLFGINDQISKIEIKLKDSKLIPEVKKELSDFTDTTYRLEDKYELNKAFYAMMKSEKLAVFMILLFILLIASFNIIGSISMLILDKKEDLGTYKALGMTNQRIISVFKTEGNLITMAGAVIGLVFGTLICLLQEKYGFQVMHHMGQYDVEKRDYAYSNSLPALEAILKENPSIEVVIDLHRDEVAEGTRLVTEIGGKKMARFMFFNGLSRTRRLGDIDSLPNKNIADNLAFSFQMQVLCNEYYPGLTRRIYLKGYRYNMHLKQRYLLIEMGAQTNTYEECMNSCVPLAQMLDLELSGKTDFTLDPEKG